MKKSRAKKANHNFDNGPYIVLNEKNSYFEDVTGYYEKCEFNSDKYETYFEDSDGYWEETIYDDNNKVIHFETADGCQDK